MKKILLLGSGGNCLEIIDLLKNEQKEFVPFAILSPENKKKVLDIPILGDDKILLKIKKKYNIQYAFPAVGFGPNTNNKLRKKIFTKIINAGLKIPNLISKYAVIRSGVKFGKGVLVQAGTIIDTNVRIKDNVNIGLNVTIGHEAHISSHVTIAGNVNINGSAKVGEGSFLGMSSSIFRNVGSWCKIGPNIGVIEEIKNNHTVINDSYKIIKNIIN